MCATFNSGNDQYYENKFLSLLERSLPEFQYPISKDIMVSCEELTKGVEIDLDLPLSEDDEGFK